MWHKVSDDHAKLAVQRERKKEKKAKAASASSSFSGFSFAMPVPLWDLSSSSSDNTVVASTASSSSACAVTFALLIVSAQLFVSPGVDVAGEPSWKRKREDSDSSAALKIEIWAEFEKLWALPSRKVPAHLPVDRSEPSSFFHPTC